MNFGFLHMNVSLIKMLKDVMMAFLKCYSKICQEEGGKQQETIDYLWAVY
jgi:hypothetical protein